jgi:hypothetical protein
MNSLKNKMSTNKQNAYLIYVGINLILICYALFGIKDNGSVNLHTIIFGIFGLLFAISSHYRLYFIYRLA